MNFISVSKEDCTHCDDEFELFHIPLPLDSVSYEFGEGFFLHLDRDEMQTLYLAMKEHLMGLADVQPVE